MLHSESAHRDFPLHMPRTAYILSRLVGMDEALVCGAFDGDRCVGLLVAQLASHPFIELLMAEEMLLYIHPEKRGSRAFKMLMSYFEDWAGKQGVNALHVSDQLVARPGLLGRLLQRLGFYHVGGSYLKRLR